jgi:hypothetical protein
MAASEPAIWEIRAQRIRRRTEAPEPPSHGSVAQRQVLAEQISGGLEPSFRALGVRGEAAGSKRLLLGNAPYEPGPAMLANESFKRAMELGWAAASSAPRGNRSPDFGLGSRAACRIPSLRRTLSWDDPGGAGSSGAAGAGAGRGRHPIRYQSAVLLPECPGLQLSSRYTRRASGNESACWPRSIALPRRLSGLIQSRPPAPEAYQRSSQACDACVPSDPPHGNLPHCRWITPRGQTR